MAKAISPKTWALPLRSDGQRYSKQPITPPTAIARSVDSATQITLTASGGASGLGTNAGYRYRRNGVLINANPTASPLVDMSLTSATQYTYTATLVDSAGNESDISAPFAATTATSSDTIPPTAPAITATALSASTIRVNLATASTDVGSGFRDYTVQWSISASGPWNDLQAGLSGTAFPITHTGLTASTQRFYRALAFDNVGNSSTSAVVSATTSAASVGASITYRSGWSGDSTLSNGGVLNISRPANDLGSGPSIAVFGNFRGGTPGQPVPAVQQIGAFSVMGASDGLSSSTNRPMYRVGPDGDTWADIMNATVAAFGDGATLQMDCFGLPNFDQWYCSFHQNTNGPVAGSNYSAFNQKTLWVVRGGDISGNGTDGNGNDVFCAARGCGGNSGFEGNFWDAPSHGADTLGIPAPNGGYPAAGHRQYQSMGIKPHTAPATQGALYDSIIQNVSQDGYYKNSSTGLGHAWHSAGGAYWNSFFFVGYLQMRGASPAITQYLVKDFLFQYGPNAWKRFFITNAATVAASTEIYDCPHVAWAGNGVSIYTGYGFTTPGKYLWYGNGNTATLVMNT